MYSPIARVPLRDEATTLAALAKKPQLQNVDLDAAYGDDEVAFYTYVYVDLPELPPICAASDRAWEVTGGVAVEEKRETQPDK